MANTINDYRRNDNRHQVRKHKISKDKKECYKQKRKTCSFRRYPARSSMKNILVNPDNWLDAENCVYYDTIDTFEDKFEPIFHNIDDCLAFELHELIENDDTDQIEALLLYSRSDLYAKTVNITGRPARWLYPLETPLIAAARKGNDKLIRMFLNEFPTIDVNLKIDVDNHFKKDDTSKYWNDVYQTCHRYADILNVRHDLFCQGYCSFSNSFYDYCYCPYCRSGYCDTRFDRTALWLASYNGHLNVVRILVEIGKADVNIVDQKNWTPLRAAIAQKHIHVVKYLIEEGNANIDECRDLLAAVRSQHDGIVDYLLEKGCDPNTRLINEELTYYRDDYSMFALNHEDNYRSGDISVLKTLLKHGADPTLRNENDETALHIAIQCRNNDAVQLILNYGFKHNQMNRFKQTPLMLAIGLDAGDIRDILYKMLPRQQYIDEIMLLACQYACQSRFDFADVDSQAFTYFEEAFKLQEPKSDAIPCDVYRFRKECQTIDELRTIQFNSELMYIQGLLVYERLLPQRDQIHIMIPYLIDLYKIYLDMEEHDRCLLVLIHTCQLSLSCKENLWNSWDTQCITWLVDVLGSSILQENISYIDQVLQAFRWTLNHDIHDNQLCYICIHIAYLIQTDKISMNNKLELIRSLKQAISKNRSNNIFDSGLFHKAISMCLLDSYLFSKWTTQKDFLELLIFCGGNINEVSILNSFRPLHLVAWYSENGDARLFTKMLLEAGAHTDCLDFQGFLPEERAQNIEIKQLLHSTRSRSLKCQCTRLILKKGINYKSHLSRSLNNFVLMHHGN